MANEYRYHHMTSKRSRFVALVLCVCGGFLGLHHFYVKRYWRAAVNLFLLMILFITTNIFGVKYFYRLHDTKVLVHWRELLAVGSAAVLGTLWFIDIVLLAKGQFKDADKLLLK